MIMKRVASLLSIPFLLIAIICFLLTKDRHIDDLLRYKKEVPYSKVGVLYFCYVIMGKKEYRNVFLYRLGVTRISRLVMPFTPPIEGIEILTKRIGSGIRVFHKSGCTINAYSIGQNFSCGQGTTIGIGKEINGRNCPVIGNNVWVGVNATLIGGITIGDNATIGAGSVVVHDVRRGATVVGNPAREV